MVLYRYIYMNAKGKKKSTLLEAESEKELKEQIRAQNTSLISFEKAKAQNKHPLLKTDHLITFTTQLSSLLTAGMPLYESLLSLEEQYQNESFHPLLLGICKKIQSGTSLSQALALYPKSFSPLYCSMIAAGESIGALDTSLEKLATLLTKQRRLKKQLTTALIYPLVLFGFSLLVCLLLMTFVVPSLETLFEERSVNTFTHLIMKTSHFLTHQQLLYLPILIALVTAGVYGIKSKKGKYTLQKMLLKTPLIHTLIIQSNLARFSRTMGTLLQGGVSVIEALQIGRKVMRNQILEKIIANAETKIIEGSLLSLELKKNKLIPSLVPRLLAIGEEGGNAPMMFNKIADLYEEEVEKTLNRVTALAQPVILIVMGAVVGMIMLAVLLPLTDVNAFL